MQNVLLATAIAAVTEFGKRIHDKDYRGALVIAAAALVGALAGFAHIQGLTVEAGLIAGLGVAGIHTIAKQVG